MKQFFRASMVSGVVVAMLMTPLISSAQSIQDLLAQIAVLQAQLQSLQSQIAAQEMSAASGTKRTQQLRTSGGTVPISGLAPDPIRLLKLLPDIVAGGVTYPNGSSHSADIIKVKGGIDPALVTDAVFSTTQPGMQCTEADVSCTITSSAKGNVTGPRYYSLADPMNPKVATSHTWNINTNSDAFGDYGAVLSSEQGVAYSEDGTYSALRNSQGNLFFFRGGQYKWINQGGTAFNDFSGIMQSGGQTFFIGNSRILNMTNFDSQSVLSSLPGTVPTLSGFGKSAILGNTFGYFDPGASGGKAGGGSGKPSLKLYSLAQSSALASVTLPNSISSLDLLNVQFGGFTSAEGYKYFVIVAPVLGTSGPEKLYMYRVASSGSSFTPIAEGLALDAGLVTAFTGVSAGGNRAFLTFNQTDGDAVSGHPHAYFLSDLAVNKVNDVLSGAPPSLGVVVSADAYVQGDTTYVYTSSMVSGNAHEIRVWKFGSQDPAGDVCKDTLASRAYGQGKYRADGGAGDTTGHYEEVCTQWVNDWAIAPQYSYYVFKGVHGTACTGEKVLVTSGTEGGHATQAACQADLKDMNPGQCHPMPSQAAWDQYYKTTGNQVDGYMYTFESQPSCAQQQYCVAKQLVWKGPGGPTSGRGTTSGSSASTGDSCGDTTQHAACVHNSCQLVSGAGSNRDGCNSGNLGSTCSATQAQTCTPASGFFYYICSLLQ